MDKGNLAKLAKLIRYWSLTSTTTAGSGHPTSSLSAADLMAGLFFGGHFRFDIKDPQHPNNDRLIFSKGHASPLFYSLWAAVNTPHLTSPTGGEETKKNNSLPLVGREREGGFEPVTPEELMTLRKFGSRLEGHPSMVFPFTEVATGSLGQGLSVGAGMALNAKYLNKLDYKTYVLLGDSEMAEGSVWEAMASAVHYKLDNLIAILDVNRLGQRGETMYGHDTRVYQKKAESFGWETVVIDGHNFAEIESAFAKESSKPKMIIAKTLKGKGVSFIEDKDGWHGKALTAAELELAKKELGDIDESLRGELTKPATSPQPSPMAERVPKAGEVDYKIGEKIATRKAYGNALVNLGMANPNVVVLDAEVSNSTFAEKFKEKYPERFFEMFIAEQNMVGAAMGLSRRGKIPFVSTFAAFLTRAFDQIRMSQYADSNIKFCGSHAGVSIGEDGASQMGLEDIAMFRTLLNSVVLYPADAVSTERLVEAAAEHKGNVYIRTTRKDTPVLYDSNEQFPIGGSKVLRQSAHDRGTVVAAGITLHEALAAYEELKKEGISIRVIDLYSVKPLDIETLKKAAAETGGIVTVEDHFAEGGIGEAVASSLSDLGEGRVRLQSLAVRKMPKSGKPEELLDYEEIGKNGIVKAVKAAIHG